MKPTQVAGGWRLGLGLGLGLSAQLLATTKPGYEGPGFGSFGRLAAV